MFGYVTPCKMELKIKDFEKFKAYYCGLCRTIKKDYGNLPRLALNYDMTFLALLLDSLSDEENKVERKFCSFHPFQKRVILQNNEALSYAAYFNVLLTYHKLLDNVKDDNSSRSKFYASFLNLYLKKAPDIFHKDSQDMSRILEDLYETENASYKKSIDEYSHHFAQLTGYILSDFYKDNLIKDNLFKLGYNLGKWIYIIDALDDLENDLKINKFNAISSAYNEENLPFNDLFPQIQEKINFILTTCAVNCLINLENLPIKRNEALLHNILQFGLMEKMDKVFNRKEVNIYEKSL